MATTTNTSNSNSKTLIDQKQVDKNISSRMTKNKVSKVYFSLYINRFNRISSTIS